MHGYCRELLHLQDFTNKSAVSRPEKVLSELAVCVVYLSGMNKALKMYLNISIQIPTRKKLCGGMTSSLPFVAF
jgi:hypothetical protein